MAKARTVVITDSTVNNYGFRLLTEGGDISQYERNNILLFMHNRPWRGTKDDILAIGNVVNLRKEGDKLLGDLEFDEAEEFAKKIMDKWDAGIYKMVSPGVEPIEFSDDPQYLLPGQKRSTVTKWRLEEISVVDIAGNDNAIALYNNGKLIKLSDAENNDFIPEITKIENNLNPETNNMKTIAIKLGLGEAATETEILNSISDLQSKAGKVTVLEQEKETITLAGITSSVEKAIAEKRITADKKEHFITLGKTSGIKVLDETLSMIQVVGKPTDVILGKGAPEVGNKKFMELSEEERITLRKENTPEYIKLFKAEYGFEPKIEV